MTLAGVTAVWQVARRIMRDGLVEIQRTCVDGAWYLSESAPWLGDDDEVWGSLDLEGYRRIEERGNTWWSLHVLIHLRPESPDVEVEVTAYVQPPRVRDRKLGDETITVRAKY